jgi:hypothetical protein
MIEQNKSIVELKCHPFMWYFMMVFHLFMLCLSIGLPYNYIYKEMPKAPVHFTIRSFMANSSLPGLFIFIVLASIPIFLFIMSLYHLITFSKRIVINDSAICIFMPFFTWRIPLDEILRIKVKQYKIKYVFITIIRKNALINLPIPFNWYFQSTDNETVLIDLVKRFGGEFKGRKYEK